MRNLAIVLLLAGLVPLSAGCDNSSTTSSPVKTTGRQEVTPEQSKSKPGGQSRAAFKMDPTK